MPPELRYAIALALTAALSGFVAWFGWQRRSSSGSAPLSVFMLALTWWAGTYALHWINAPQPRPYFWLDMTYAGVVITPAAFLLFALEYTGRRPQYYQSIIALLSIEPVLTLLTLWTDPLHGLFFGADPNRNGAILEGGPWFLINVVYSYGLVMAALILLTQMRLQANPFNRRQLNLVLIGALLPFAVNVLTLGGLQIFPGLDLTPFAFTLTGVFLAIGMFYFGLLDIVPVARHTLVEELHDGVMVLDTRDRVVDINPAAQQMIGQNAQMPIGDHVAELLAPWPHLLDRFGETRDAHEEITVVNGITRIIDLHISPLYDNKQVYKGRLVVFRDISASKETEQQLRLANQQLQQQLDEIEALQGQLRDQALRDPLTGLFNRRHLADTLKVEIAQASRQGQPLSVVLMDIDHFKTFNDKYGHMAGDRMLEALSEILLANTRRTDIAYRYGGEEFVVVLPNTPEDVALKRMENFRQAFQELQLPFEGQHLHTTLSIGVALYPEDGATVDDLLNAADKAMYNAKEEGGNLVKGTKG